MCHHLFQFRILCNGTWYSNGNCSSGSAACIQLEICALSAGCSLLISPGRCLGLEPKWHCHFGIPRQRTHLSYVSILMMGCLWGFAGVDILRTSTVFPSFIGISGDFGVLEPQIHHLSISGPKMAFSNSQNATFSRENGQFEAKNTVKLGKNTKRINGTHFTRVHPPKQGKFAKILSCHPAEMRERLQNYSENTIILVARRAIL